MIKRFVIRVLRRLVEALENRYTLEELEADWKCRHEEVSDPRIVHLAIERRRKQAAAKEKADRATWRKGK
jgi:hypothetical protein